MARAKIQGTWYYVLVFTHQGPVYVTSWETYPHRVCEWNKNEVPKEMSKDDATYMAVGLYWNGTLAQVVASPYKLESQPFQYDKGEFVWKAHEA